MTVALRSFAKINLGLRIGPVRPDGFHELLTVYQTIGLHDLIRISVERGSGIEIRCTDPRVPRDESNTCYQVVERARAALGAKGKVVVDIEKRLPLQGGLGGASANAVATLLGLERVLKKTLGTKERLRIAAEIGSDLPLFLIGGTVLGIGRGERVYPLQDLPGMACVVLTPAVGVSTPRAFAEWDRMCGADPARETVALSQSAALPAWGQPPLAVRSGEARQLPHAELRLARTSESARPHTSREKLTSLNPSDRINELGRGLSAWPSEPYSSAPSLRGGRAENPLLWLVRAGIENDFEEVVFPEYPKLREGKHALLRAGAKYASLSGSGSALYGLFTTRAAALKAVQRLRSEGWAAQTTSTLTRRAYWSRIFD